MIPDWVASYMQIPFVEKGRGPLGCDCYGLVRLVLAERYRLVLPELLAGYASTCDRAEIADLIDLQRPLLGFDPVEQPQPGDVVHIRQLSQGCHLGIMVTPQLVLHTEAPAGPRCERIAAPTLRPRILGFYRHGGRHG